MTPKELKDLVELPDCFKQCWYWFLELNSTRSAGFGISSITYTEMYHYFKVLQIEVQPWEIEIVKMFDAVALDTMQKQQEQENRANKNNKKQK